MGASSYRRLAVGLLLGLLAGAAPARAAGSVELYLDKQIAYVGERITALAFSPAGDAVACGAKNGEVTLVDPVHDRSSTVFLSPGKEITALAWSPDGRLLAVAPKGKRVWLVNLGEDPPADRLADDRLELKEAEGRIDALCFSPDGRYLAAGGDKKKIFLWESPSGHFRGKLEGHEKDVLAVAFDTGERRLISVGRDGRMILWDPTALEALRRYDLEAGTMPGSGVDVTAARISDDRQFVAVAVDEHILRKGGRGMIFAYHLAFFDVSKGVLLKTLPDNNRKIEQLTLYPGNCFVAYDNSTNQNKAIALGNIEAGEIGLSYGLESNCRLLEFSPDGRKLAGVTDAVDGQGSRLNLWDVIYEMPASGCFMSRIRITSTGGPVIGPHSPLFRQGPVIAAVLPFAADQEAESLGLGRSAAHFLETKLVGHANLRLVERSRIDEIVAELRFQQSGLVDRDTAVSMGKLLGARLIITGNFDRLGADLVVSARVIDAESGEILGTKQVHCGQCGADDIFDVVELLGGELAGF